MVNNFGNQKKFFQINTKPAWFCVENLIFVLMLGFMLPITLSVSFTNSGILYIYPSMFVYIVLGILFLSCLRNKAVLKHRLVLNYLALCVEYVIAFLYRLVSGGDYTNSLMTFFWTIMPVSVFLLLYIGKLNAEKVSSNLYWAMTVTNITSVIYHLLIIKTIRSTFFENVNNLVFYCILSVFINTFYYMNISKKFSIFYIFNMCYCFFVLIMSGSRGGFLCGIFLAIYYVIFCFFHRELRKPIGLMFLAETVIIVIFLSTNLYYCRSFVERSMQIFGFSRSVEMAQEIKNEKSDDEIVESMLDSVKEGNTDEVMAYNDLSRLKMWRNAIDEVKKAPLIGTGKVVVFRSVDGGQLPHNFILEYCIIYGGIGLILWGMLAIQVIVDAYKKKQRGRFRYLMWFLFFTMMFSFVEPTLSNAVGPFLVWCGLGIFLLAAPDNVSTAV